MLYFFLLAFIFGPFTLKLIYEFLVFYSEKEPFNLKKVYQGLKDYNAKNYKIILFRKNKLKRYCGWVFKAYCPIFTIYSPIIMVKIYESILTGEINLSIVDYLLVYSFFSFLYIIYMGIVPSKVQEIEWSKAGLEDQWSIFTWKVLRFSMSIFIVITFIPQVIICTWGIISLHDLILKPFGK